MNIHRSLTAFLAIAILALFAFTGSAEANDSSPPAAASVASGGGAPVVPAPFSEPTAPTFAVVPPSMRAKMRVSSVTNINGYDQIVFEAVCPPSYDPDGLHEDSSFSKWTPSAKFTMSIGNPALVGRYKEGDTFYTDFTPVIPTAEPAQPADAAAEKADPNDLLA